MQKLLHKIIVILLTPIVLFSTTSFTIEKHNCGEMICSVSLKGIDFKNKNNDNSNIHSEDSSCINEEISCCTGDIDCCSDDLVVIEGNKIKKEKEIQIKVEKIFSINDLFTPILKTTCNKQKTACQYASYSSPIIVEDILVTNQVFRI